MSAEELLRSSEQSAIDGKQIISHVVGKTASKKGKLKGFSATAFATAIILVFVVFFSSGNLIPAAISERLIEETDVQYADAVESKILVFQQALISGEVPTNTIARLKESGVIVGQVNNGEFSEGTQGINLALKMDNEIILAKDFVDIIHKNVKLYNAFNNATYSRAAYYYDETAQEVFRNIGTNRNNYSSDKEFTDTVDKLLGEGNSINTNNVYLAEKTDKDGKKYYEYEKVGSDTTAKVAGDFVSAVSNINKAENGTLATLNAADTIKAADTIAKEQKASLLFVAFMENISKMKAGDGNESKINETMNYLYQEGESGVLNIETGEVETVKGSMLEAPSLYAILSGEKVDTEAIKNYSSDRTLKAIENKLEAKADSETLLGTIASTSSKLRSSIGRFLNSGGVAADAEVLNTVAPIVENSLINNSFTNIKGIAAGEMLVEGAVKVGGELAKAGGGTAGDNTAVKKYAKLNNTIVALDAEADRLNRSPLDITSKNTFLGSIIYKMAISINKGGSFFNQLASITRITAGAIQSILPTTYADDESDLSYLTNFGDCETLKEMYNASGTGTCTAIATFDTSTLNDIYKNTRFIKFVEANTELKDGVRVVKDGSNLADFIKYLVGRKTPLGIMDGGILKAVKSGTNISFVGDILSMIKSFLGSTEEEKQIASGAAFVNSKDNTKWETYKYAQRYVSLARATEALRIYDGEETAYSNIKYFEGSENPVIAFLNNYNSIANK